MAASGEHDEAIRYVLNATGTIMSPQVAFYTLQGIKTLSVRMDRQSANAQVVAEFLESHQKVDTVCYPGLDSVSAERTGSLAGEWFRRDAVV